MIATERQASVIAVLSPMAKRYLLPYRGLLLGGVLGGLVAAAAAGFGLPTMIQHVFPVVFGTAEAPPAIAAWLSAHFTPEQIPLVTLWLAALFIPLLMMLRGLSTYFNGYLLNKAAMRGLRDLRCDTFTRLQWLSFSHHDRRTRGELMNIVLGYTGQLQQGMVTVLNDLVIQPLTLIAALSYLIYAAFSSHESAILMGNLLVSALIVPLVRCVGKRMVKHTAAALEKLNSLTAHVEESLNTQREIRAFNLEAQREKHLRSLIRHYNRLLLRVAAWKQALGPSIEVVSALALAYSLYRGCSDGLTLEQFSAIATAFYFCYDPVKKLGDIVNQCQVMAVAAEGVNSILEAKDETPEPPEPLALPRPTPGSVRFEHVCFAYTPDSPVLRDIDVHIPAGQIVALVGPSGSGKTTFINLICRFYDVDAGCIRIDGIDVRRLSRAERTRAIGLVSQFSALFSGSIRENIRLGRPEADDAAVELAGARARVDEFTAGTPEGYERELGEGGSGLSGGQRQRVSIARAFLKNAPILILDEATSALDMKSEALIQEALDELAEGHTTFIIAHRFSTIRRAQRILVFDNGRIIADGTHDTLYEHCPLYRRLYDEQVNQAAPSSAC
ncbi:MAG: ABC transporter ATP-binding protein [Akkermansia sp.]